jgi:hypothetical protein
MGAGFGQVRIDEFKVEPFTFLLLLELKAQSPP